MSYNKRLCIYVDKYDDMYDDVYLTTVGCVVHPFYKSIASVHTKVIESYYGEDDNEIEFHTDLKELSNVDDYCKKVVDCCKQYLALLRKDNYEHDFPSMDKFLMNYMGLTEAVSYFVMHALCEWDLADYGVSPRCMWLYYDIDPLTIKIDQDIVDWAHGNARS